MQIKVEIVKRDENIPDSERQAIHVETHARRGDAFAVMRTDTFLEGQDVAVLNVPSGGRIVINTPLTHEEMVYDRDQMAAVRLSQQRNPANMAADRATGAPLPVGARTPPPQGMEPLVPGVPPPVTPLPADQKNAETSGRRYKPDNVVDTTKEQQQTSAGRPAGETPPKPGSTVGSPPEGNEGKDQKG